MDISKRKGNRNNWMRWEYVVVLANIFVLVFLVYRSTPNTELTQSLASCPPCSCSASTGLENGITCDLNSKSIDDFKAVAMTTKPLTDKCTHHNYHHMYGMFLGPLRNKEGNMLEIGFGAGGSIQLWLKYLPRFKYTLAEYSAKVLEDYKHLWKGVPRLTVVQGDQANRETLKRWIRRSGGNFDLVVDDGGHSNKQIMTSFEVLWPEVKPGGLYFIEDMQVGRWRKGGINTFDDTDGKAVVSDILQDWLEQLVIEPETTKKIKFKLPAKVKFVYCMEEACAIGKCALGDNRGACSRN